MSASPVQALLAAPDLIALGARAHVALDALLDELPVHERAALAYDWAGWWARPEQVLGGDFASCGILHGRGWGGTSAAVGYALQEARSGRAMRIGLVAQSEAKTVELLVEGESGVLAMAAPWDGAVWEPSAKPPRVTLANGSAFLCYTPHEPTTLRGQGLAGAVATELPYWPRASADEALSNLQLSLRLGRGWLVWDTSPRRRDPLIRALLERANANPERHILRGGPTSDNAINLAPGAVEEWIAQWGGTQRAREELEGRYEEDSEASLFRVAWLDKARRHMPDRWARRIVSVDPAITADPRYSDSTGIAEMGAGIDGQVYLESVALTGKHRAEVWPGLVVDSYVRRGCDLALLETNRGGTAHVALLRVACRDRGLSLVELGPTEKPTARAGVLYVRTINVRGTKGDRAAGAAALAERGRLSLVIGADYGDFEDRLLVFDGTTSKRDDDIDALVNGCHELADLAREGRAADPKAALETARAMQDKLTRALVVPRGTGDRRLAEIRRAGSVDLTALLRQRGGGRI